jgi:hypothetical protein
MTKPMEVLVAVAAKLAGEEITDELMLDAAKIVEGAMNEAWIASAKRIAEHFEKTPTAMFNGEGVAAAIKLGLSG